MKINSVKIREALKSYYSYVGGTALNLISYSKIFIYDDQLAIVSSDTISYNITLENFQLEDSEKKKLINKHIEIKTDELFNLVELADEMDFQFNEKSLVATINSGNCNKQKYKKAINFLPNNEAFNNLILLMNSIKNAYDTNKSFQLNLADTEFVGKKVGQFLIVVLDEKGIYCLGDDKILVQSCSTGVPASLMMDCKSFKLLVKNIDKKCVLLDKYFVISLDNEECNSKSTCYNIIQLMQTKKGVGVRINGAFQYAKNIVENDFTFYNVNKDDLINNIYPALTFCKKSSIPYDINIKDNTFIIENNELENINIKLSQLDKEKEVKEINLHMSEQEDIEVSPNDTSLELGADKNICFIIKEKDSNLSTLFTHIISTRRII